MALGADGTDEGTEATQARVIPRYRRVVWKRWRLSLTKPDITNENFDFKDKNMLSILVKRLKN